MKLKTLAVLLIVFGAAFAFGVKAQAFEQDELAIKIFDKNLNLTKQFNFLPEDFFGDVDMTLGDITGDGQTEIIVSLSDRENDSKVIIYSADGLILNEFHPYVKGFKGMIYITSADLDNDGVAEIITGAGYMGGPQVRIFDHLGETKFVSGFWAEDKDKYRNGVRVAAGDVNGDGLKEIITTTVDNKMDVKFFNRFGQETLEKIELSEGSFFEPGKIISIDLGVDGINELVVNYGYGNSPKLMILRADGSEITSFDAYHPGFGGGVDMASYKEGDRQIFVTGAGYSGGPHVRFLDQEGNNVSDPTFFVYPDDYKGGVNVAALDLDNNKEIEYVVAPKVIVDQDENFWPKHIEVDISKQKLYVYEYNRLIREFWVSTGKWSHPTPLGKFKVYRKRRSVHMRWSYGPNHPDNYDLPGVPYVLSFVGAYTIHGTYWHSNFGHRMSHGCVNMYTPDSQWVYNWAPMGTPVIVHNGNIDAILGRDKTEEDKEE